MNSVSKLINFVNSFHSYAYYNRFGLHFTRIRESSVFQPGLPIPSSHIKSLPNRFTGQHWDSRKACLKCPLTSSTHHWFGIFLSSKPLTNSCIAEGTGNISAFITECVAPWIYQENHTPPATESFMVICSAILYICSFLCQCRCVSVLVLSHSLAPLFSLLFPVLRPQSVCDSGFCWFFGHFHAQRPFSLHA